MVHLVGFTIEIYHDARSHERQTLEAIGTYFDFSFFCSPSWVPDIQQGLGQELGCHRSGMNLTG